MAGSQARLTLDMTEDIIDNVSGPDDIETLLTCSLVSKTWLRRSRQRMFRRVFIPDEAELGAFTDLCAAPLASIPDYVQELVLGRNARGTVMKLEHDQLATLLTLLPGISDLTLINILWHTNEAYPALAGRLARMSYQPRHLSMLKLLGVTGRASTLTTAGLASLMHLFDAVESLYFLWDTEVKLLADGGSVGTTAKFRAFPTIYDLVLPNTPMSTRVLEWMDDMGLCGSLLSLSVYISDNAMLKALGKVLRSSGQSLRALSIYLFGWKQLTRLSADDVVKITHVSSCVSLKAFNFWVVLPDDSKQGLATDAGWQWDAGMALVWSIPHEKMHTLQVTVVPRSKHIADTIVQLGGLRWSQLRHATRRFPRLAEVMVACTPCVNEQDSPAVIAVTMLALSDLLKEGIDLRFRHLGRHVYPEL